MAERLAPAVDTALTRLEDALAGRREFDPRRDVSRLVVAMPSQLEQLLLPAPGEQDIARGARYRPA